jgi:predicted dehydrogenase
LGYHHARIYHNELPDAELVGIVDTDPERRAKLNEDFGVTAFETVDELLEAGIDAASVVVPTRAHHDVSMQMLEAGVDLMVEKPIATTEDEARAMVAKANECGRIFQVGHIERFNGAVVALFEKVKKPRFIECHRLSPYSNRGDDVSVVLDLMIHDLDIIRALDGTEVVSVDAIGVPIFSEFEDIANVRIRFASGCVANVTCSRVSLERMRKIRIFAEESYVSTDYSAQELAVYRKKPGAAADTDNPMELIDIDAMSIEPVEPLKRELQAFSACVEERGTPVVSGEDALAALELAQRVVASIKENA